MLLDCPVLHCDPHPGNLRRTPEGKLCIMDWGLTTSIPQDLQLTFIEHVAHLVARDYASVPADLVKLGFVPRGKEDVFLSEGVVEVLADIYGKWALGGGAAKIGINKVVDQLNGLASEYGNIFQVSACIDKHSPHSLTHSLHSHSLTQHSLRHSLTHSPHSTLTHSLTHSALTPTLTHLTH
jgi:predicted unusual protein kinase regulating ubiquinone biosynthesis (AarF/ABC1/UbiB family)